MDEMKTNAHPPRPEKIAPFPSRTTHKIGVGVGLVLLLGGSILAPFFLWLFVPLLLAWIFYATRNRWLGSPR